MKVKWNIVFSTIKMIAENIKDILTLKRISVPIRVQGMHQQISQGENLPQDSVL